MRSFNAAAMGSSTGFDAKEKGKVIRVIVGSDGQLWTWRSIEDYRAGRCTYYGQQTLANPGLDALEYCEAYSLRNEETERVLSLLRPRANKELVANG